MDNINKNDVIELTIDDLGTNGQGIGRAGGLAVFVTGALPGEVVRAKVIARKKSYAVGKLEQVVSPSPMRAAPPCRAFGKCGGCTLQHLSYAGQLEWKRAHVESCVRRIGGLDIPVLFPLPSPREYRYRNKAAFPVQSAGGVPHIGLYAPHSHRLVDVEDCKIQHADVAVLLSQLRVWLVKYGVSVYDEETHTGLLRHIVLRQNKAGEMMLVLVVNGEALPHVPALLTLLKLLLPQVKTVVLNHNTEKTNAILGNRNTVVSGPGYLFDTILGLEFKIGPSSFLQVNPHQTEALYKNLFKQLELRGEDTVFDLYCGAGTITLPAARRVKAAYGIEIAPEAVENAKFNANLNDIENTEFLQGDARQLLSELVKKAGAPDIVIADPPRKGLAPGLAEAIAAAAPRAVGYVSCDPATLARDLAIFAELGYRTQSVQPVDLFPQTVHIESVTVLY